jgi:hypothetical protein
MRSRIDSTSGSFLARNVLKKMEKAATAIMSSVAWYGWGAKLGLLRIIRASISSAVKKQTPAIPLNCESVSSYIGMNRI